MQVLIILLVAFVAAWLVYTRRWRKFPPGPPRWPIVGNIFQLGVNPHKSLAQLAKTYGPLMSLQLGAKLAVVVSSPEMAKEILQNQGLVFSNRSAPDVLSALGHDEVSVGMLPGNSDKWKKLRRIARENLFSNQALEASQVLRQDKLRKMIDIVTRYSDEGRAMNVGEITFTTLSNLIFATFFSIDFMEYGAAAKNELHEHVNAITRNLGLPNISDYFPILTPMDLQGRRRTMSYHFGGVLEIAESMIKQRQQARRASSIYHKKNDFLETLLDLMEGNEYDLSIQEIKNLFLDLILAGSDTSTNTMEWAMVELLLNPDKLAKLKAELKSVIGEKRMVEESDISKLPYLQKLPSKKCYAITLSYLC